MAIAAGPVAAAGRRSRSWPLQAYFALLVAVFVLAAAAGAAYVVVQSERDARSGALRTMGFAGSAAARDLSQGIATVQATVAQLAANPGIAQALTLKKPPPCNLSFSTGAGESHLDVVRPDGSVLCSSRTSKSPVDYGSAGWLTRARTKPVVVAPVYDAAIKRYAAVGAAPAAGGAVVAAFVDLVGVGPQLASRYGSGNNIEFLVTTADGRKVLARSINAGHWLGRAVTPGLLEGTKHRDLDGQTRLYAQTTVRGPGWRLYTGELESAALAPARRLERRDLLIVGIGLALVLAAALFAYRRIARPLGRLSAAVHSAGGFSPPREVAAEGPVEVVRLATELNRLTGSVAHELDERRIAEGRLRRSEESYRALFDGHPAPMWVYDAETLRFLAVNRAAVAYYGYSEAQFLEMTIADIRPPEDRAALHEIVKDPARRGDENRVWRHVHADGAVVDVKLASSDTEFDGRHGRLVLVQDVTEQRRLEGQLLQVQKMDAVGSLAGGIAHDFNNLLTIVRTSAALLLGRLDDPALREDVERIDAAGARGADLTRQLLAFSRRQVLRPEVVDMNAVVGEARSLVDRLLGSDIEIAYELAPDLSPIVIDRGQLLQAIVNLAVNARDAMPHGGRLTLTTSDVALDAAYAADHVGVAPGTYVALQVTDSGVGMDEAMQQRAFEPFFTTKDEGTGLGLATVYGIVHQSNGHIWLYSEPGLGTTFKLYFPRASAPVTAASKPVAVSTLEGTETILLVEDDQAVRPLVATVLRAYGYTVLEAASPEEALRLVEGRDDLDLLLTDVVMPGMNGRELAELLIARQPTLKVLYTSGYPADAMVRAGIADSSAAYIEKPYLPDELARTLRVLLDQPAR
jgi:PAS domain S-box-containing protein